MFFRMVYDEKLAEAAYLIGCQRSGEAIVIDPERDVDRYERLAAANGLRIVAVAETHIHADFLSGARELAEKGAAVYVSDEGDVDWKYGWLDTRKDGGRYDAHLLHDGDTFSIGRIDFTVVHTPGHTPEHICFMVTDRGGGADEPIGVATGDFVFVGDLGRPDLLESAAGFKGQADPSAHRLFRTVQKFLTWPEHLQVWPAHGAGSACGKALGAVPQSTVGYEKRFNASIKVATGAVTDGSTRTPTMGVTAGTATGAASNEAAFVRFILEGQPEPPLYFARMKRDNKLGPKLLGGVPRPRQLSAQELLAIDGGTTAIVDTRPWAAFRAGHFPGSLSLPLTKAFPTDAGSIILEDEPMVLVVEPARLDEAVRDLIRVGLDTFVGWFDAGAMDDVAAAGVSLATLEERTVPEARAMLGTERPFVLDVRRGSEFSEGHIEGATNIAHTRLRARLDDVPKDRPILVNCLSGGRSARAASLLQREGYRVTNLAGGMQAWERQG